MIKFTDLGLGVPIGAPTFKMFVDALINGVATLGSSAIQAASQASTNRWNAKNVAATNDTNLRIAQETNAANAAQLERQLAWNRESWALENAYNSPSAQLARLRAAGINANDAVNNGNAQSIQTANSQPMQGATMQPFTAEPVFKNGFDFGVKDFISALSSSEDIKSKQLSNQQLAMQNSVFMQREIVRLQSEIADLEHKGNLNEQDKVNLQQMREDLRQAVRMNERLYEQAGVTTDNLKKTGAILDEDIISAQKRNLYMDDTLRAEISSMSTNAAANYLTARANERNARTGERSAILNSRQVIAATEKIIAETRNARTDGDIKRIQRKLAKMDVEQRNITLKVLYNEFKKSSQKLDSPLGMVLRYVLGTDFDGLFSGSAGAVGAAAIKAMP